MKSLNEIINIFFFNYHIHIYFYVLKIKDESFLEDINNLLNAGEVPNLFATDEKQEICDKMRSIDRQRDKSKQTDGSPVALLNMFIQRCRDQLHIVLAMSPIGEAFRTRLRKFPALVNCCTIDWFQVFKIQAYFKHKMCLKLFQHYYPNNFSHGLKMRYKQWHLRH